MLAANVCAAEFLIDKGVPALFRVHAGPTPQKLKDLRVMLFEMGLDLSGGDKPSGKDYAALLAKAAPGPEGRLLQTLLLRSLSQAMYGPEDIGHFALGYEHYTHFTSPIRRYPDLVVHRAIKSAIGETPACAPDISMKAVGEHCSLTERRADDATRDVIRSLKTEYMADKVAQEFDAVVSGVMPFGLFVELADIYVDGLVHVSSLGHDYYHFDPAHHRMVGERTGQHYRLGDAVRVRLLRVDIDEGKLDFELIGQAAEKPSRPEGVPRPKRRRRSRRG